MQVRRLLLLMLALAIACSAQAISVPKEAARPIPLSSIYTTSKQQGLVPLNAGYHPQADGSRRYEESYGPSLHRLIEEFGRGPANVALVRGKDISQAIDATRQVFVENRSPDSPVGGQDQAGPTALWLVAYLGTSGSEPEPGYLVQSIERRNRTIRFVYVNHVARTHDVMHCFFWARLGEIAPGPWTLELFDAESKDVTLQRRVRIPLD